MNIVEIVFGIFCIFLGVFFVLTNLNYPSKIPPQYPCVTAHKEGNKTVFRNSDSLEVIYEYKEPKQASKNTSKIVSVDSDGFTISTPKRKEKIND